MADFVQNLVPEAKVGIAHGQLKEDEIEEVMTKFIAGTLNVLVTTTIIESGIDIPTANTIIINRADRFGLADLYQIKGRVGRSREKAYAYLLTPADETAFGPGAQAAPRHPGAVRARRRVPHRGAGPRDARRRQSPGQAAVGPHRGRGHRPLHPDDGRGHGRAARGGGLAGAGHADQHARIGVHPRGLYQRREPAARCVQGDLEPRPTRRSLPTSPSGFATATASCPSPRQTCSRS